MSPTLEGRRAVVTGGTRGIGRAIAERLRDDGAAVTVTGTRPDGEAPPGCEYVAVDFEDRGATDAYADELRAQRVDVLINSAGINRIAPFADIDPADFDALHEVNVRAPFTLTRAVVPRMCEEGWGRIVNITSVFGVVSRAERGAYSTTKFGLAGMTAALAVEVARSGVLANCVAPGFVDTELTRRVLGPEQMAHTAESIPARRLARPDEIAPLVAWLASPENTYVTGQNVVIDGGFTCV